MIIYCAGPIKGNTTYQNNYSEIIRIVESLGHIALSEKSNKFNTPFILSPKQIYTRDIKWIDGSKIMIAEISGPSLGVGFEISYALFVRNIPVLALHDIKAEQVSSMILGCNHTKLTIQKYADFIQLNQIINDFITINENH